MNNRCVWCKYSGIALLVLGASLHAFADPSQAGTFASQAGVIAGAAQACGQPIALMTSRTNEVINALATNPTDVNYAMAAYQRAIEDSAASQNLSQKLTCNKVVNDFNNLPLLRPDYQQTVIAPLLKDKPPAQTSAATAPATATTAPATTTPTTASSGQGQAPAMANSATLNNIVAQPPVPAQQVVTGNAGPTNAQIAQQNAANEAERIKLAQQLAQMAQSLVADSPQGQAQLQQQALQNVPYPERNSAYQQYQNSPANPANAMNGTNNPAYNKPLGVQPYPAGQNMNNAMAIINDPGSQPYPTNQTPVPSYPP